MRAEPVEPVPVGVVGVGHMGRLHARTYARLPGARLVGVCDLVRARAEEVAAETGARVFDDAGALARSVRAASIAVPTHAHRVVAEVLLAQGCDVLVEKPLAPSSAEARLLVEQAARAKAVLMVGHSERFNPAVVAIESLLRNPGFVEVHRLAPFSERGTDVDVILDLMIHDLDLLLHFVGSEVVAIDAVGVPVLTSGIDIANARLRFASGTARAYRLVREAPRPRIEEIDLGKAPSEEPVSAEIEAFLHAVKTREDPPASGHEGLLALELAERVRAAIEVQGCEHER